MTEKKALGMTEEQTRRRSTDQSDTEGRDGGHASEELEEYRFAENLPDDGGTVAEREYDDYVLAARDSDSDEPDVLLDVPVVKLDELNLDVEELRARVSLQADVLNLLKLQVGADVFIGQVGLELKGVEAQALLKVRLENVARILDRVMTTIDRNPQLLEELVAGAGRAVSELGQGAGTAVEEVGEGTGSAVEEVGEGAGTAVEEVGQGAGGTLEDVGDRTGSAVEGVGERVGEGVERSGLSPRRKPVEAAARPQGKAAGGAAKTAKPAKRSARKAQEQGARQQRTRTRGSQGTRPSNRQERDSAGRSQRS
jgi:hypothetical protein